MAKPSAPIEELAESGHPVVVDFYQGAYGPTITIDVMPREALVFMRDVVKGLSSGSLSEFVIRDGSMFLTSGLDSLLLRTADPKPKRKRVVRRETSNVLEFVWTDDRDGWRNCLGRVGGLLQSGGPGHQYLSDEGFDDALIELSYGERSETVSH